MTNVTKSALIPYIGQDMSSRFVLVGL